VSNQSNTQIAEIRCLKRLQIAQQRIHILQKMIEDQTRELYYKNVELERIIEVRTQELLSKNLMLQQRNEELMEISYVASHDLQEPLKTISGFVDLFRNQFMNKIDTSADLYIKYITEATSRLQNLIKDLLDFSRIGKAQSLEEIDCNKLISGLLLDLSSAIQESEAVIQTFDLPVIVGSNTELRLLFQNLISNAIKFRQKDNPPEISISCSNSGNELMKFEVADNGIGIESKFKEKIFVLFQRLHNRNEYQGTGIGLAHCKKIVERHGGTIWVDSTPGIGSTFYFTIKSNHNEKKA